MGEKASAKDIQKIQKGYGCSGTSFSNCGGHWSGDSGTLSGAGSGGCEWVLRASTGKGITIAFSSFSVGKTRQNVMSNITI